MPSVVRVEYFFHRDGVLRNLGTRALAKCSLAASQSSVVVGKRRQLLTSCCVDCSEIVLVSLFLSLSLFSLNHLCLSPTERERGGGGVPVSIKTVTSCVCVCLAKLLSGHVTDGMAHSPSPVPTPFFFLLEEKMLGPGS